MFVPFNDIQKLKCYTKPSEC